MLRSKATLLATTAALAAAISVGVAAASASTGTTGTTGATGSTSATGATGATGATTPPATAATITVNGAGLATVDPSASTSTVQSDYLTALQSALTDAHAKAVMLAGDVGDTLGAVQNVTEQSNDSVGCAGPRVFSAAGKAVGAPSAAPTPNRHTKHHSKPRKATAQISDVTTPPTCSIEADVTVTYAMS